MRHLRRGQAAAKVGGKGDFGVPETGHERDLTTIIRPALRDAGTVRANADDVGIDIAATAASDARIIPANTRDLSFAAAAKRSSKGSSPWVRILYASRNR
jgi:hypothetical protein